MRAKNTKNNMERVSWYRKKARDEIKRKILKEEKSRINEAGNMEVKNFETEKN